MLTAQFNLAHYDGGDFLVGGAIAAPLPDQTSVMGEVGFLINDLDLSPIVRFEHQSIGLDPGDASETRIGGGLGVVALWSQLQLEGILSAHHAGRATAPDGPRA